MSRSAKALLVSFALAASTLVTTALAIVASPVSPAAASTGDFTPKYTYDNNDGVSQIYNFGEHTCGVQDNVLWCWGANGNFRLGSYRWYSGAVVAGNTSTRPMPRLSSYTGDEGNFLLCPRPSGDAACSAPTTDFELSATKGIVGLGGLYTTCIIQGSAPTDVTGRLYCMGYNQTYQAGQPTNLNQQNGIPVPSLVPDNNASAFSNSNIISVDGGVDFSCALKGASATATSGAVYCWGNDTMGQLGNGSAATSNQLPVAAATGGGFANTAVSSLSVGFHHSCAIEGGQVFCWGNNSDAVANSGTQIWPPQLVSGCAGAGCGLLITTGGGGRAGRPVATASINQPAAVQTTTDFTNTNVTQVSAGYRHTCAIQNGSVFCWGNNQSGQLGDGTTTASSTPVKVSASGGFTNTNVTQVVAGDHFTCALEGGSAYCWGEQQLGRLGNSTSAFSGSVGNPFFAQSTPVKVADGAIEGGNTGLTGLAPGSAAHSCALKGGKAYCWGAGRKWGTLSDGSTGTVVYAGLGSDFATDAPRPRLVQWGPPNRPSPYDPVYPPGIPTDVVATPGWNKVTVNWTAPTESGTYQISHYLVTSSPGGRVCISSISDVAGGQGSQCTYTSLTPGTAYTFKVQALSGAGWGDRSTASNSVKPTNLKITSYSRKARGLIFGQDSEVRVGGVAPGFAAETKIIPWVRIGDGQWVSFPSSPLSVSADGRFTWIRRFAKAHNGKPISIKFEFAGNFTNTVIIPNVKTNRGLLSIQSSESDVGGMPDGDTPTADIDFGFDSGSDITLDLPVVFTGRMLKPGTNVTATVQRTTPAGSAASLLGSSPVTVDENGDVFVYATLPTTLSPGIYDVVFSGTKPDGTAISETNTFELTEGQPTEMFSRLGAPGKEGNYVLYTMDVTGKPTGPLPAAITAIAPQRLVDTRESTIVAAGGVLEVQVTGRAGVPAGASTAMLNVTGTGHLGNGGYLTVYACEDTRPTTSSLNLENGGTVANAVTVKLGASGKVCIFSKNSTHVVVDVTGYAGLYSSLFYSPMTSTRIIDTRQVGSSVKRLKEGQVVELTMPAGVPAEADAVALNITLDATDGWGWASVYPCGQAWQNTSTVNSVTRETVAASALALLGTGDKVCVYTSVGTDLIVDVFGWYSNSVMSALQSHNPFRMVDSRVGVELSTVSENGETIEVADDEVIVVRSLVPAKTVSAVPTDLGYEGDASAVVANLTVAEPAEDGYLTVYDCSTEMPIVSSLNFKAGETRANQIIIPTTSDSVCVYNSVAAHIIVDLVGRYTDDLLPPV